MPVRTDLTLREYLCDLLRSGSQLTNLHDCVGHRGPEWHVVGVGQLNGDQTDDIVRADASNNV